MPDQPKESTGSTGGGAHRDGGTAKDSEYTGKHKASEPKTK